MLGDLGFDALLPLLRARTVEDVDRALDGWVEPVNNVVIADRTGAVRYRVAGRVPVRDERNRRGIVSADDPHTAWTGWLDPLPREDIAADGQLVTANERRGPESTAIGTTFAPPHRARRLHDLMAGRADLTPADFASFHGDTLLPILDQVVALLDRSEPGLAGRPVRERIRRWDGRMDAGSPGAAAYAAWRSAFVSRLSGGAGVRAAGRPGHRRPGAGALAGPDHPDRCGRRDPARRRGAVRHRPDQAGRNRPRRRRGPPRDLGRDARAHADPRVRGAGARPGGTAVPETPVSGDIDCVRCTGSQPGLADECWRGSVARYVWDLADRDNSGWVVPLGASGDPRDSHHHDQLALWAEARLAPIVTDWDRLTEEA